MRVEPYEVGLSGIEGTRVVLSRRNLLALLAKLDGSPPCSACTIEAPSMYGFYAVTVEEDEPHYNHPERVAAIGSKPGEMHPDTEARIA